MGRCYWAHDIGRLVEETVGTFWALHIAFNNAGIEGKFGLLTTKQTVAHYYQVCSCCPFSWFWVDDCISGFSGRRSQPETVGMKRRL